MKIRDLMQAGEGNLAMGTCRPRWGAAPFYSGMIYLLLLSRVVEVNSDAISRMIGTTAISSLSIPS